ncbi:MAG: putative nucleic acid-binding protein [Thalassolituus oleivorans]|jgi:predicted nucleic acid-binding protein
MRGARTRDALAVGRLVAMFQVLPVTTAVAQLGGTYRHTYGQSHGSGLVDSLIGATAELHDCRLATNNGRLFPMVIDVVKPY